MAAQPGVTRHGLQELQQPKKKKARYRMLGFGSNPEHRFEVLKYRNWPRIIERENMAKLKRTTLQEHTKYALV